MAARLNLPPEAYRRILENLPAAVYLVDRDRKIALWNDAAERITGYRRHEVIGRCCADDLLMHCDEKNDVLCGTACPLLGTIHDGQPREMDLFLRHKDGQRVPVRVRAVPIRDDDGTVIGACESFEERDAHLPVCVIPRPPEPAARDSVTQLPDRAWILQGVSERLREFESSGVPAGVIALAVDHLEQVAAKNGGYAVHQVLYTTGRTLEKNLGVQGLVGRWSGNRFAAVLTGCSPQTLLESARMLVRLAGLERVAWWGGDLQVTLSAAATIARPGDTPEDLIMRADEGLNQRMEVATGEAALV